MSEKNDKLGRMVEIIQDQTGERVLLEWRFHPSRRWRLDLAVPSLLVGLEVQGGVFSGGKHGRGDGQLKDHEKLNHAQLLGWIVLQATPRQVGTPQLTDLIVQACQRQRDQLERWEQEDRVALEAGNQEDGVANGRGDHD